MSILSTELNKTLKGRELEDSYNYSLFFRPKDGFVGDVIPYYENGTFYIFYLKDQGNSYNHSIFLVETKDFIHYVDKGLAISSSRNIHDQDDWAGTGSICKVDNTYYFFYTGHNNRLKTQEKIIIATSENDLYHFNKINNLYIEPIQGLSHRDFRDPDAHFDEKTNRFILTITTNSPEKGRMIAKFSVSKDLTTYHYEGEVFTEKMYDFGFNFYNFECSDIFKIGKYWYLSYSCQDDCLWINKSTSQYEGYDKEKPYRLEGKYFYVPKAVSDGINTYIVGWARGRNEYTDSSNGTWGGNLLVSKVSQKEDGTLYLSKIDGLDEYYCSPILNIAKAEVSKDEMVALGSILDNYKLEADISFSDKSDFAFIFGKDLEETLQGKIRFNSIKGKIEYIVLGNKKESNISFNFVSNKKYHITLVIEGSVAVLYVENEAALTCRFYEKTNHTLALSCFKGKVTIENVNINTTR